MNGTTASSGLLDRFVHGVGGWSPLGGLVGIMFAIGVLLVVAGWPSRRRIRLEDRIGPYVAEVARPSRLLGSRAAAPVPGPLKLAMPALMALGRGLDRVLGADPSVRRRLLRAGQQPDVDRFRAEQVLWGAVTGVAGAAVGLLGWRLQNASPVGVILLVVCCVGVGVIARDQWLSHSANRREQRMLTEFPTIAELLALAVSAGEGAAGALDRVCRLARGELAAELAHCLADARAGASLPAALEGLADRTGLPSLARFVDGIVVAVQRGTPLAEVLRAQAQDVREVGRRAVMEEGGRKEIAMMVPVVFLILPVTVLFAVFPGVSLLQLQL